MKERTIFLHGFSKAFSMTGWRIGYACGPAALIEAMMKVHQYSMLCASIISQEAAIEALVRGEDAHEKNARPISSPPRFHRAPVQ
jgi:aminotransferase